MNWNYDSFNKNIYNNILKHKSSIIFVNTRAQAEVLFQSLWKINKDKLNIAVHHGSLEKKLRINGKGNKIMNDKQIKNFVMYYE